MSTVTIFLIVLVAAFAAVALLTEPSKTDKLIHARLVALDRNPASANDSEEGIIRQVTFSSIPMIDRFLRHNRFALRLQLLLEQADLRWTVGRFAFISLTLIAVGAFIGNWWIAPGIRGWLPGIALGVVPLAYSLRKRGKRFRQFNLQLPEAIDLMSRGLRAGQALQSTLDIIGREISPPVGTEFRRAADEQSYGLPFREALLNLSRRLPLPDLRFLVTAILVQKETGGNLAEVLDKTSHLLRERLRVGGQVRIHTAQGRATGWVLCALPFLMFVVLNILNPGYARVLFQHPMGQKMVSAALVMMFIGVLMIRRIVRIRI